MLVASIAVARAESFWELPFIGRFFAPRGDAGRDRPAALPVNAPDATDGGHAEDNSAPGIPNVKSST